MASMNDSTKKKKDDSADLSDRKVLKRSLDDSVQQKSLQSELTEMTAYWGEAVQQLKGEQFASLEDAIKRVVELAANKIGNIAADSETRQFMYEMLISSEEVVDILRTSLDIQSS